MQEANGVVIEQLAPDGVQPAAGGPAANGAALLRLAGQRPTRRAGGHRLSLGVLAGARLTRLLALSLLVAPALLIRGALGPTREPRLLRWYFETCGGGYVKIGQLLATRYDLLQADYTEELGKLLDSLPPVPTAKIIRVIEEELGRPLADVIVVFEPQPIATASLAQVHGAVLADGDEVVVKILKPGIAERVRIDLAFLRITGRVVDVLPVPRGLDVNGLVEELARTAIDELDPEPRGAVHRLPPRPDGDGPDRPLRPGGVPAPVQPEHSHPRARPRGDRAGDAHGDHQRRRRRARGMAARGITPERTAVILLRSVLEQTMRLRSFNADPHPSNLIVSDGGTLNWVDFGLMGWIDERQWELQLRLREAIAQDRVHDAYLALLEAMEPLPFRDLSRFEQEIKRGLRDYLIASRDPSAPLAQV